MKEFQLFRYLNRWKTLICLVSLFAGVLFYGYAVRNQTFTAHTVIVYSNAEASSGRSPGGSRLDTAQIFSSKIITEVIAELGLSDNIEALRSNCTVEPVIPEEEEARKQAVLEKGEVYHYYPTRYLVSYTASHAQGKEHAKRVLDAIVKFYYAGYSAQYIDQTLFANNASNVTDRRYDFLERVELLEQSVLDILDYLSTKARAYPNFRSARSGYCFADLKSVYEYIDVNVLPYLYSDICNQQLTQNADVLRKRYGDRIESDLLLIENYAAKMRDLDTLLGSYVEKNKAGLSKQGSGEAALGNPNYVLSDVYERYRAEDSSVPVDTMTTYDSLVNTYVDYATRRRNAEIDVAYCRNQLDIFANAQSLPAEDARLAAVDSDIRTLVRELDRLYALLGLTVTEFNEYLASENLSTAADIAVSEAINIRLALLLVVAVFFLGGCVGSIVLGRAEDIVDYFMYVDRKTKLPNRLRCDRRIDGYAGLTLPDNMACVAFALHNLRAANEKSYALGDEFLATIGGILSERAKGFGFVAYNGGGQFLGIFEDCSPTRAAAFIEACLGAVSAYNAAHAEAPMEVSAVCSCTDRDRLYDIRELVRATFGALSRSQREVKA